MESKHRTLFSVLNALLAENNLLGWNVAPQKSGCVLVKIRFSNMEDFIENGLNSKGACTVDMPDHRSYRKLSVKQTERNYSRAQKYKGNSKKRPRLESPELPRTENLPVSSMDPTFDLSSLDATVEKSTGDLLCLDSSPVNHYASDHDESAYEECIADHEICASVHSATEIQVTQLPESPDILIPKCEMDDNDNVSICSEFSDNPRSVEPCEHKGCSYGPAVKSRKDFYYDDTIFYCCECKNNPFYPDVTLCSDCLIRKNRHKKHKRHARCVKDHEPPLGNWRWAVCAPD